MGPTLLLFAACAVVRFGAPAVVAPPVEAAQPAPPPSSTAAQLERIDQLLATVDDIDRRDRLVELRDLASAAGALDLVGRRRVSMYVERVLLIEERAQPVEFGESGVLESPPIQTEEPLGITPVSEVPLAPPPQASPAVPLAVGSGGVPTGGQTGPSVAKTDAAGASTDPTASLRAALVRRDYLAVVEAVDASPELSANSAALSLRSEAVEGWCAAERESAAAAFLAARNLVSPLREAALKSVLAQLTAINKRFPGNSYAAEIEQHVAMVTKELGK